MPHAIFLHSALTQNRIVARDPVQMRRLFRFELADVFKAMTVAGLVNGAMLIMAASTFFYSRELSERPHRAPADRRPDRYGRGGAR